MNAGWNKAPQDFGSRCPKMKYPKHEANVPLYFAKYEKNRRRNLPLTSNCKRQPTELNSISYVFKSRCRNNETNIL